MLIRKNEREKLCLKENIARFSSMVSIGIFLHFYVFFTDSHKNYRRRKETPFTNLTCALSMIKINFFNLIQIEQENGSPSNTSLFYPHLPPFYLFVCSLRTPFLYWNTLPWLKIALIKSYRCLYNKAFHWLVS